MRAYMGGAPARRNKAGGTIPLRLLAFGTDREIRGPMWPAPIFKSDDTPPLDGE
jgi:hypothetical protein